MTTTPHPRATDRPGQPDELARLYARACSLVTDIHEHLPTLYQLACRCEQVTELGTRGGNSTLALLHARPRTLHCYDVVRWPQVDILERLASEVGVALTFHHQDDLTAAIEPTDLLFIDTWHVEEQLRAELNLHAPHVRKWLVFHDTVSYGERGEVLGHRGLRPALDAFLQRGTFRVTGEWTNNNGLLVLERCRPESEALVMPLPVPARIYLSIPWYQGMVGQCVDCWDQAIDPHAGDSYVKWNNGGPFHCRNFNTLWCSALNSRDWGWTHFAMIHADVRAHGYWLSTLLRVLREEQADIVSVVLPIKSQHGLTSTALRGPAGNVFRLTMQQVMALPETFDAARAGYPDHTLLISSGLWLCDFRKPWVEQVWFEVRDRIVRKPDGEFVPQTVSEDWAFSYLCAHLGLKVVATRAVPCGHWGIQEYRNDEAWGTLAGDNEDAGSYGDWYTWPVAEPPTCGVPALASA